MTPNSQSGNILIYILGAIVLIGILVTMVKGSSTPGAGIDREALEIRVAEVQQYGNELERAVAYILRSGYSESDIRFAHPNHSSLYGDITDDPGRQIFAREGGGATWRDNPDDIQTSDDEWIFTSNNIVNRVASQQGCGDDSCTDLIALLTNVSLDFCLLVNDRNGLSGTPPQDVNIFSYTSLFDGNYTFTNYISDAGLNLKGNLEACFEGDTDPPAGTYHYYRVLLAR